MLVAAAAGAPARRGSGKRVDAKKDAGAPPLKGDATTRVKPFPRMDGATCVASQRLSSAPRSRAAGSARRGGRRRRAAVSSSPRGTAMPPRPRRLHEARVRRLPLGRAARRRHLVGVAASTLARQRRLHLRHARRRLDAVPSYAAFGIEPPARAPPRPTRPVEALRRRRRRSRTQRRSPAPRRSPSVSFQQTAARGARASPSSYRLRPQHASEQRRAGGAFAAARRRRRPPWRRSSVVDASMSIQNAVDAG